MKNYYQKRYFKRKYEYCKNCGSTIQLKRYARPNETSYIAHCFACGGMQHFTTRPIEPQDRCVQCRKPLDGKDICPFCGSRQGHILEFRTIRPDRLTEHALLLFHSGKGLPMKECRAICHRMTPDMPYRMHIKQLTDEVRQLMTDWNALGGKVVRCADHETSRRPYVELRSFDHMKRWQYVHLLMRYHELCNCKIKRDHRMTASEAQALLTRIVEQQETKRLSAVPVKVTNDTMQLDDLIHTWEWLGGEARRNPEYGPSVIELCTYRQDRLADCRTFLTGSFGMTKQRADSVLNMLYCIREDTLVTFEFRDHLELIDSFIAEWRSIGGVAVRSEQHIVG